MLAALENSSRVVRAYLAYYGILGMMISSRADNEMLQVIRRASKFAPLK